MHQTFKRWDLLNYFIEKFNYKTFLEIGVQSGYNNQHVKCKYKLGVDPDPTSQADLIMTSDDYFDNNIFEMFDIIFIDGLHEHKQVYRDIVNALDHLTYNGTIVCHDMLPPSEEAQEVDFDEKGNVISRTGVIWNGDCWKAFAQLRSERKDLEMYTVQADYGLGVIRPGQQEPIDIDIKDLTYENLCKNQRTWMNTVTTDEIYKISDNWLV